MKDTRYYNDKFNATNQKFRVVRYTMSLKETSTIVYLYHHSICQK